jgi:DNA-nicking Smr family endonuclease
VSKQRDGRDDAERSPFADAMRDVKPLAGRNKTQPPPATKSAPREAAPGEPVEFELLHAGERLEGHARGIDHKHLRRLRSGKVPVDLRIDLHGLNAREARTTVREALLAAAEAGQRCALVIHGRGQHSAGDPILKRALPEWLAEPSLGPWIMAFSSATPADGGTGAAYVLLRRHRVRNAR